MATSEVQKAISRIEQKLVEKKSAWSRFVDIGRRLFRRDSSSSDRSELLNAIAVVKKHYLDSVLHQTPKPTAHKLKGNIAPVAMPTRRLSHLMAPWSSIASFEDITPIEKDLFRAKAISTLRCHSQQTSILKEALEAIRSAPIHPSLCESEAAPGLIKLHQAIQLRPGVWGFLEMIFQRNAHSKVTSMPLSDSFRFVTAPETTLSYPLPMHHNGWALNALKMPSTHGSPGAPTPERLRWLVDAKCSAFMRQLPECLKLHEQLARQICLSGGRVDVDLGVISDFIRGLKESHDPLERLSQVYQLINQMFIEDIDAVGLDKTILWIQGQERNPARDFMALLGPILARGAMEPHEPFGCKLIQARMLQLDAFAKAMHRWDDSQLIPSLHSDIACFH